MPDTPTMGTDPPPNRPLPDCLTRFLSAPSVRPIESTPGDRPRNPPPLPVNLALRGALLWAVLYNVAGFGLLYWVWSTMRVPAY